MAGPRKVSTQDITNALLEWRGNVQAAAEQLGLSRNGLYERIHRLGLNLEGYRRVGPSVVVPVTGVSPAPSMPSMPRCAGEHSAAGSAQSQRSVQENRGAKFTGTGDRRRFGPVEATASAPIQPAPRRRVRPARLRPPQEERLVEAKFDLGARYRVETTVDLILQQFFAEEFDRWLQGKMQPAESEAPGETKRSRR